METNSVAENAPLTLTVNGGSSSIKFAVFSATSPLKRLFSGQVERIGTPGARLTATRDNSSDLETIPVVAATFHAGVQSIVNYLSRRLGDSAIGAIGHRIVHGGMHLLDNQLITEESIAELRRTQPLDLAHLPREIALIEGFRHAFPAIPQIACFDTAFHRNLPLVAQMLPIPRRYHNAGVRRFGFHGLSYTYLMSQLATLAGPEIANGRVILAHLGSGASMAAVRAGKPIDTTMAFTPTSGLVMATRPGDLDPGLLVYLAKDQNLSNLEMDKFISQQCGLLGVSETSSDMRDLLAARPTDPRAAEAVDLFCYQAKKHLCALTATLGGLDTLVFSGGIGEHAPEVRAGICQGLDFLGLHLDPSRNARGEPIISSPQSRIAIRIIPTDEEIVIARIVRSILQDSGSTV
ncbi:MAG: acetate/propionate family kinase [Tepidisphaeraceae bacterium]|jgi:acetate kinase